MQKQRQFKKWAEERKVAWIEIAINNLEAIIAIIIIDNSVVAVKLLKESEYYIEFFAFVLINA